MTTTVGTRPQASLQTEILCQIDMEEEKSIGDDVRDKQNGSGVYIEGLMSMRLSS